MTMERVQPGDAETHSMDVVAGNVEQLKALFPDAFTEGKIDFEVLKQLLGGEVEEREEKYGLSWHGKRRARQIALTPSAGTLRPCPQESVDWDTTQNLMIEGDNLEVLKLLQKSYAGKVKLIYIDPPYNTGKDFVYADDFRDSIHNYLKMTGQVGGDGIQVSSNSESSGRFHTDWLDMVYPRLKLARNLLRNDGAIFISIDSTEVANLRLVCDEIFGGECFVIDLIWKKRDGAPNDRTIGSVHDHILVYGKSVARESLRTAAEESFNLMPRTSKADSYYQVYREPDGPDSRGPFRKIDTTANAKGGRDVKSLHYGVTNPHTGQVVFPREGTCWRHSEEEMGRLQADSRLYWGVSGTATTPMRKLFMSEAKDGMTTPSILPEMPFNQHAARELEVIYGRKSVFDTPKPVDLLRLLTRIGSSPGDIVLDFFAGSGSLGEAVMRANSEGLGGRRFILVQLPERLDSNNGSQKPAVEFCDSIGKAHSVAELTKERLRRASASIAKETSSTNGDIGMRVYKLDASNIRPWNATPENLEQETLDSVDNILPGRSEQDVLFELLLHLGLDLCVPIETHVIGGKDVHAIGGGVLFACLPEKITSGDVEAIAHGIIDWHKELDPVGETKVYFRDSAFTSDEAKANIVAILEQYSEPESQVKMIVRSL